MKTRIYRLSNFELMRMVAMFMIVASHYAVHGITAFNAGYLQESVPLINKFLVIGLGEGGSIGVALFFMLSGFFLCKKDNPHCIRIITQTFFYAIVLTSAFIVLKLWGGYD